MTTTTIRHHRSTATRWAVDCPPVTRTTPWTPDEVFAARLAALPPLPEPAAVPADASWYARARQADRAEASADYTRVRHQIEFCATDDYDSDCGYGYGYGVSSALLTAALDARWAAAQAAVPFVHEPEPLPATGSESIGLAKGCAGVGVPRGAIARRGGGEWSGVIFYDAAGEVLAAYRAESEACETWVVACEAPESGVEHGPIQPATRSAAEAALCAVFGGR